MKPSAKKSPASPNELSDVLISIVTFNHQDYIGETLDSIAAHAPGCRVVILDNGSTDDTVARARNHPSGPELLFPPRDRGNLGFGGGHNYILEQTRSNPGRYFVIYNPDLQIQENTIGWLRGYLEADRATVAASPLILNPDLSVQTLNRRRPTLLDLALRLGAAKLPGIKRIFRTRLDRYVFLDREHGYHRPYPLETMTGCFMFFRRSVLEELGGFDPRFFLYFEDTDLSLRAARLGKLMFLPQVSAIHHWGRGQYANWRQFRLFLRSLVIYFRKWGWRFF